MESYSSNFLGGSNPISTPVVPSGVASTNPKKNVGVTPTVPANPAAAAASTLTKDQYAARAGVDVSRVITNPDGSFSIGALPNPNLSGQSTTTLSSDKSKDIANIQSKTTQLGQTGVTTDTTTGITTAANGQVYNPSTPSNNVWYNADGSVGGTWGTDAQGNPVKLTGSSNGTSSGGYVGETYYPPGSTLPKNPDGSYPSTTPDSAANKQIMDNLNKMIGQNDAMTASLISGIQQQYQRLIEQQQQANAGSQAGLTSFLLKAGGLQGTGSGQNVIGQQVSYGINQIADLNSKEQSAILQAQQAGQNQDFQIQDQINQQIDEIRKEKQDAAVKLNDQIVKANKDAADAQIQSSRDSAISSLYSQGITDVASMLDFLNYDADGNKIDDFTAKEINDTLSQIVPPGLDDLVKTLRTNGAPAEVIKKVMSSTNLNDAYDAAGLYSAGGTGIVGEYNFYRANALAAGQQPVDFNTYQDIDTNRKKSIAKAGASGGGIIGAINSPAGSSVVPILTSKGNATQQGVAGFALRSYQANQILDSLASKSVDQSTAGFFLHEHEPNFVKPAWFQQVEQAERNFVNAVLRKESGAAISDSEFNSARQQYFPQPGDSPEVLAQKKQNRDTAYSSLASQAGPALGQSSASGTPAHIQQSETDAQKSVTDYGNKNANIRPQIQSMISAGKTYLEISQILGL